MCSILKKLIFLSLIWREVDKKQKGSGAGGQRDRKTLDLSKYCLCVVSDGPSDFHRVGGYPTSTRTIVLVLRRKRDLRGLGGVIVTGQTARRDQSGLLW